MYKMAQHIKRAEGVFAVIAFYPVFIEARKHFAQNRWRVAEDV